MLCRARKSLTSLIGECLYSLVVRRDLGLEHSFLKAWTDRIKLLNRFCCHRLHDEMDVYGLPARVRPEARVDLVRIGNFRNDLGRLSEQRTQFECLCFGEIGEVGNVTLRLDDQRSHAEGSDAMLDQPVIGSVDPSSGKVELATRQVTGQTGLAHSP